MWMLLLQAAIIGKDGDGTFKMPKLSKAVQSIKHLSKGNGI